MQTKYEKESVEKYFTDYNLMSKKYGAEITRSIKKRIDQLMAATTFSRYLETGLGKPHQLSENFKGYYGISVTGNLRLLIKPDSESLEPDILKECDTVIIRGVLDYHGKKDEWIIS